MKLRYILPFAALPLLTACGTTATTAVPAITPTTHAPTHNDKNTMNLPLGTPIKVRHTPPPMQQEEISIHELTLSATTETVPITGGTFGHGDLDFALAAGTHPVTYGVSVRWVQGIPTPASSDVSLQTVDGKVLPALSMASSPRHIWGTTLLPDERRDGLLVFAVPDGAQPKQLVYRDYASPNVAATWTVK